MGFLGVCMGGFMSGCVCGYRGDERDGCVGECMGFVGGYGCGVIMGVESVGGGLPHACPILIPCNAQPLALVASQAIRAMAPCRHSTA